MIIEIKIKVQILVLVAAKIIHVEQNLTIK